MGGFGSGRRQAGSTRPVVEGIAAQVDVRRLQREGKLQPGTGFDLWPYLLLDPYRDAAAGTGFAEQDCLLLRFRWNNGGACRPEVEQLIPLDWTHCRYGGRRPWFLCRGTEAIPCSRRVAILYGTWREPHLFCRGCCELAYASQRQTAERRALNRARKIRDRLEPRLSSWRDPLPEKPPRMRRRTYARLTEAVARDEAAALAVMTRRLAVFRVHRERVTRRYERELRRFTSETT